MKLAIMQPYFFPYLGYFQLILAADRGVVFDVVKYTRKSWMNRNRVLSPSGGWQYLTVPVRASQGTSIRAATVEDSASALQRIQGQIEHYRGKAPYYSQVRALVSEAFASTGSNSIGELNTRSVRVVCDYLGIPFDWSICSEMALDLPPIEHAGQWALEISASLGAAQYINAPGGRSLFRPEEWIARGIELRFLSPSPLVYSAGPYDFVENLSVLDVLMWNDVESIVTHLRNTMNVCE